MMQTRTVTTYLLILLASGASVAAAFLFLHRPLTSEGTGTAQSGVLLLLGSLGVLGAVVTWLVLRLTDRPVEQLRKSLTSALQGDYRTSAAEQLGNADRDLVMLARDFDGMTERVRRQLTSRARMLRNISDELRAPLSRLQAIVSIMRQKRGEDDALASRMERELSDLHGFVAEVLTYSQLENRNNLKRQRTNLSDLIRTIAEDAAVAGVTDNITVSLACPDQFYADIEHGLVYAALENLVRHGMGRLSEGGALDISLTRKDDSLWLDILHRDKPITEAATLDHLFDPFNPSPGAGGMSLAVAQRAIMLHNGTVDAVNSAQGLRLVVALPTQG